MKKFTPETAPKNGRPKGSKNKLNAQAWKAIEMYLADFAQNGSRAIKTLRVENTPAYVKLGLDLAALVALEQSAADNTLPMIVTVKWIDPKTSRFPPPLPPETAHPISSPPHGPARATPPPMLTLLPRPDAPV